MRSLRHPKGGPKVVIHGPVDMRARGGTVAFNVLDRAGRVIPYWTIETCARDAKVALRGGCFCNPGASEFAFGLSAQATARCFERLGSAFSVEGFSDCLGGEPVGALRASVGIPSNDVDIRRAVKFVDSVAA